MRWAAIVRVSHMGVRKAGADDFHADRDQVEVIRRYAAQHGADVVILPPELSVSGGRPIEQRPSLRAAIEGVEAGVYSAIVVAYLSRLTRSRSGLEIWDRVEAAGGHVHCAAEAIDTSTANGRFIRDIHLANAVREREEHADRFGDLRQGATAAGIWQRRQTPLGYARDPSTRKLVASEDAEKVRRAFTDRIAGKPVSAIARDLEMTASGVRALLRNRVYLGELSVGEHVNPTAHPAIVDGEVWHLAQASRVTRPLRVSDHPGLLRGLVRCAGCSHVMAKGGRRWPVYSCAVNHSDGRCPAPAAVTARLIDVLVEGVAVAQLARLSTGVARDDRLLVDARARLADAEAEMGAFLRGVQAAGLAAGQFADAARERGEAVQVARDDLSRMLAGRPLDAIDGDAVRAWEKMDGTQRNRLLCRLFEAVLVARAGGRGHVVAVESRVRVIHHGAGLVDTTRSRGASRPVVGVVLPELDDERVAGVHFAEDEF